MVEAKQGAVELKATTKKGFRVLYQTDWFNWKIGGRGKFHVGIPAGTPVTVIGWTESGNVKIKLRTKRGEVVLGTADIEPSPDWDAETRQAFDALPSISLIQGFDIQQGRPIPEEFW